MLLGPCTDADVWEAEERPLPASGLTRALDEAGHVKVPETAGYGSEPPVAEPGRYGSVVVPLKTK